MVVEEGAFGACSGWANDGGFCFDASSVSSLLLLLVALLLVDFDEDGFFFLVLRTFLRRTTDSSFCGIQRSHNNSEVSSYVKQKFRVIVVFQQGEVQA